MTALVHMACGDATAPAADALTPSPDCALEEGAPLVGDEFNDPTDFTDRLGCEPGTLAALDPTGTWHSIAQVDLGGFPFSWLDVFKLSGAPLELPAWISGSPTWDVISTDDDLLLRLCWDDYFGRNILAYDACRLGPDGRLSGRFAWCREANAQFGEPCDAGTFEAIRIARLPGESEVSGLELVLEWSGGSNPWPPAFTSNVRASDGVAYVTRVGDGLRIVDVRDPDAPADLGWFEGSFNDVKLADRADGHRFALVASNDGVLAIDVTDPVAPALVSRFPDGSASDAIHTLFTESIAGGTRAYVVHAIRGGVDVFDVTDPSTPTLLGTYEDPDNRTAHDLYVEQGRMYIAYWRTGLVVVDAQDPAAMILVGEYAAYEDPAAHSVWVTTVGGCKLAALGDERWGAHLQMIGVDEACPTTWLQAVGELSLRDEVSIHNIMAFGDRAYVTWYQDGLRVVDLSDPTSPTVIAYFNSWDPGRPNSGYFYYEGAIGLDVDLAASRIYLADTIRGLLIFDAPP